MPFDPNKVLSSDSPLADPVHDELGYAPFAESLANSLQQMVSPQGYVVAINGAWGLGKSTIISFILHYLRQAQPEQRALIVEFAPWMFTGHEELARRFCEQLLTSLTSDERWRSVAETIKRPISSLANAVSEMPVIGQYGKAVAKVVDHKPDIHALKKTIADALAKETRRIVVVIDDIDRLTPEEMQQLFRVIKAVANFPNVIYLLAFDQTIVAQALTTPAISGMAYLEKIVQSSFDLPLLDKTRLRSLFTKRLDILIADVPDELFDMNYWATVYLEGIEHFLTTPRQVNRLLNVLAVTFKMVGTEVNPIDFIALETLRLFCPAIYALVRNNKEMFAGVIYVDSRDEYQTEARKVFHNAWLQQLPKQDREPVKHLLEHLFPKLRSSLGNTFYSGESAMRGRKQYRVCSPDRFELYFAFMLPEGILSRAEVQAFIATTSDHDVLIMKFEDLLASASSQPRRLRIYLNQLDEQIREEVPLENIPHILEAMFQIGDRLIQADTRQGMFDVRSEDVLRSIVSHGVKRIPEQRRFTILKEGVEQGTAVSTIMEVVASFGSDHSRYAYGRNRPPDEQRLTLEQMDVLEQLAANKIRASAEERSLLDVPNLLAILYRWHDWSGEEEPKAWVKSAIQDDTGLMMFLERIVGKTYSIVAGEPLEKMQYALDPKTLQMFLDPTQVGERILRLLAEKKGSEIQMIAAQAFVSVMETFRQDDETI